MNTINLASIRNIYSKSEELCLKSITMKSNSIKKSELEDLINMIDQVNQEESYLLNGFFIGYEIPQISQEFDLLKFSSNAIINIEIKRRSSIDRIENQLQRCHYYLSFLGIPTYSYGYITEDNKIYKLDENNSIQETTISDLISILNQNRDIKYNAISELDSKFSLENYLISPFNHTELFLNSRYFLTSQQDEIKKSILNSIIPNKANILTINGNPGTGKTLLNLDLYKELSQDSDCVLFLSCIILNEGHHRLKEKGFNIQHIKYYESIDFIKYKYIVIDESQRMYKNQYDFLIEKCLLNKSTIIFSIDPKQCLHRTEFSANILGKLENDITNNRVFTLSTKIRTNPSVAQFIRALFDKKELKPNSKVKNIADKVKIEYFDSEKDANLFIWELEQYVKDRWKPLSYTSSRITPENYHLHTYYDSSHKIVGQEFDNICIYMNQIFSYNEDGILAINGTSYYDLKGMLFQNITRTRDKLCIIIVGNIELYKYCMEITHFYSRN